MTAEDVSFSDVFFGECSEYHGHRMIHLTEPAAGPALLSGVLYSGDVIPAALNAVSIFVASDSNLAGHTGTPFLIGAASFCFGDAQRGTSLTTSSRGPVSG